MTEAALIGHSSVPTASRLDESAVEWTPVQWLRNSQEPFAVALRELLEVFDLTNEFVRVADALPMRCNRFMLIDLLNVMARLGYIGSSLKIRQNAIDPRLLPCLFVDEKSGLPSVIRVVGKARRKGAAYFFHRYDIREPLAEKEARKASGSGWLSSVLARFHSAFARLVIISCGIAVISLTIPLFVMAIYDHVTNSGETLELSYFVLGAAVVIVLEWILRRVRARHLAWLSARIDHIVANRIFSRLIQLSATFVERSSVASQVARLRTFDNVREFLVGPVFLTLTELPLTLLALAIVSIIGGPMVLIPITVAVFYCFCWLFVQPRVSKAMFESARTRSMTQAHHIEMFEKLHLLRLAGMSDVWRSQFRELSADSSLATFKAQYLNSVIDACAHGIAMLAGIAMIYLGVSRVQSGDMTSGALFATILLSWRVLSPLHTLLTSMSRIEQLRRSGEQIDRLMDVDTERENSPGLARLPALRGQISFNQVGLRYSSGADPVFAGLSFQTEPGTLTAIVGTNGSGKSTILKLALGLYRPQAGVISIDGRDIRQFDPIQLRQSMIYVSQEPELFEGSIADNLRLIEPMADDDTLWTALEHVDAASAVRAMPLQLQTPIRNGEDRLSASLVYSIHLARAFVRPSQVMLFDEVPYAVLNSQTGRLLWQQIRKWKGSRTILFVSHREDLVRQADQAVGLLLNGRSITGAPEAVLRALSEDARGEKRRAA